MTKPRVSVLTPVYNGEKYIAETLESVVSQSFKDWELILMDGASKDRTLEIAKEYAARYPNIKVLSAPDEGPYDAFFKALPHAQGEFVIMVCVSDGLYEKRWLELCVDAFDKDPEISLVWGVPMDVDEEGRPIGPHFAYAHFLRGGAATRRSFLKEVGKRVRRPSLLLQSLKKLNRSHLATARNALALREPPQKRDWFPYWLKTGSPFPDGNMVVAKKVFKECLAPYHKGTRETGDWMSFYYDFNTKGYLARCIPVLANFSRRFGQVTMNVQGYNEAKKKSYFDRLAALRKELAAHPEKTPAFRDRTGKVIS